MSKQDQFTPEQRALVEKVEKHLKSRTPNAIRSNKRDRGLTAAVKAAYQATGMFAEYVSDEVKEFAQEFFSYASADWATLDRVARGWMNKESIV